MCTGIGGGEGSPGLKVACGTGSGAASCGTLSESLSNMVEMMLPNPSVVQQ